MKNQKTLPEILYVASNGNVTTGLSSVDSTMGMAPYQTRTEHTGREELRADFKSNEHHRQAPPEPKGKVYFTDGKPTGRTRRAMDNPNPRTKNIYIIND